MFQKIKVRGSHSQWVCSLIVKRGKGGVPEEDRGTVTLGGPRKSETASAVLSSGPAVSILSVWDK